MNIFESPEKIKYHQTKYIDIEELKIEDLITELQQAKEEGWELISDYNAFEVALTNYAEETDEQYRERMAHLEQSKNQRRQLYEELRKEFESE